MRMYDIIKKKRDKFELTKEEIEFFVFEYSKDKIPDYQASALLMAMYLNGLSENELVWLTLAMANSSHRINLSKLQGKDKFVVDKHSTGGVGDKVTLIVLPIVAALGVDICKMSGRGLGITGGTVDKIESVIGYDVNLNIDEALSQIKDIGLCLIGQSKEVAIADKKIYALRDSTATVDSLELIAASIMSKKIACGAQKLLLEVTVGSGAFMKTEQEARMLAKVMIKIGELAGIETKVVLVSMDEPLGSSVGNALEVKEVISFLLSDEQTLYSPRINQLREVVFEVAAQMMKLAGVGDDIEENKLEVLECITKRYAYDKFIELIEAQGGSLESVYMDWVGMHLDIPVLRDKVRYMKEIRAQEDGYIVSINSEKIANALICIGGGRIKKEDDIDHSVGFTFQKKVGDRVNAGDAILTCYYNDKKLFDNAFAFISESIIVAQTDSEFVDEITNKSKVIDII